MSRSFCRQVLECGDGVRGVTALTVAVPNIVKPAADSAAPTQSGDSEDSVAESKTLARRLAPPSVQGPQAR